MSSRPRILVISVHPVGTAMAGVGIRSFELARALLPHGEVVLAAPDSRGPIDGVDVVPYDHARPRALRALIRQSDVVVTQPPWPAIADWLRTSHARVVVDLYDPEILENLEHFAAAPGRLSRLWMTLTLDRLTAALHLGDFFMCATESQRDLWLGTMIAERIVTPAVYDADPTLRSLIDLVPFGLSQEACARVPGGGIRDHIPGMPQDAEVVLWNGGLWGWLDAITAIDALALLREQRPSACLVFMGVLDDPAARSATEEARRRASELGVLDRAVFFNDSWVPYGERANWLLDASCAVSAHRDHLETRFAFRTRVLDCMWARLPMVCTRGDALSELIDDDGLGLAVEPGDAAAMAAALGHVLARGRTAYEPALAGAAERFTWSNVTGPLREFIESGRRVPHRGLGMAHPFVRARAMAHRTALSAADLAKGAPRGAREDA